MGPIGVPAGLISKIPFNLVKPRNLELLEMAKERSLPQGVMDALEYASKKYPRILAHVQDVASSPKLGFGTYGDSLAKGPVTDIRINPRTSKILGPLTGKSADDTMTETFGHELTHAAQNIWNKKDFGPMYKASEKGWGYRDNIFESGARNAGHNFLNKVKSAAPTSTPSDSVIQKFLDMFDLSK